MLMQGKTYLFEFNWESGSINSNLISWCKEKEIDYIKGHFGDHVYADIYGVGIYFFLHVEHITNDVCEVYAVKEDFIMYDASFPRIYELKEKAIKIEHPHRKLLLVLDKGTPIKTECTVPSLQARDVYRGRCYVQNDTLCRVTDVKIVA